MSSGGGSNVNALREVVKMCEIVGGALVTKAVVVDERAAAMEAMMSVRLVMVESRVMLFALRSFKISRDYII